MTVTIPQERDLFDMVRFAIEAHTNYTLKRGQDEDGYDTFLLVDPFGDVDGDPFDDIWDVIEYVGNNDYVYDELIDVGVLDPDT